MASASVASSLSTTSSRSEQMQYLMNELGLDRQTAMILHKAERLQEKGQLQQALRYFNQVISLKPDCEEATVNVRMIEEMLKESAQQSLPSVQEDSASQFGALKPLEAEIDVFYTACDIFSKHDRESLDRVALDTARKQLLEGGQDTPLLTLLENKVETACDSDTDYEKFYRGRAKVRATFLPQAEANSQRHPAEGYQASMFQAVSAALTRTDLGKQPTASKADLFQAASGDVFQAEKGDVLQAFSAALASMDLGKQPIATGSQADAIKAASADVFRTEKGDVFQAACVALSSMDLGKQPTAS